MFLAIGRHNPHSEIGTKATNRRSRMLWNLNLVNLVREYSVGFQPPQEGIDNKTGLYAAEQDVSCFLIDPAGWI